MTGAGASERLFMTVALSVPLQSSGTSVVIHRLLEHFGPEEVVLVGGAADPALRLPSRTLPYPVVRIPSLPGGIRGDRYWRIVFALPGIVTALRAVRRYRPRAILAVFPDEGPLLIGYLLHRLTGLPLLGYFWDLYLEDRRSGWQALLARWLQPRIFASAARIIAGNEGMAEHFRTRYGLEAVCLPACINVPVTDPGPLPAGGPTFVVGYSGNINATRLGSLRAMIRALSDDRTYAIRYFTPQSPDFLRHQGLWLPGTSARFVADEAELIAELARCDVLFLPLTFDAEEHSREQLATCFGTKTFEYFLSARPILLHCPADYFMARFFREWDCGLVVSDSGPEALKNGLARLRGDVGLRQRLVRNALRAARQFEGRVVARRLRDLCAEVGFERRGPGRPSPADRPA